MIVMQCTTCLMCVCVEEILVQINNVRVLVHFSERDQTNLVVQMAGDSIYIYIAPTHILLYFIWTPGIPARYMQTYM